MLVCVFCVNEYVCAYKCQCVCVDVCVHTLMCVSLVSIFKFKT